jgi:hypothetical protein
MRRLFLSFGVVGLLFMVATSSAAAKATITPRPSSINFGKVPVYWPARRGVGDSDLDQYQQG